VRRTADGYMTISVIADAEFEGMCRALELPDLLADARFGDTASRLRHFDALGAAIDAATRRRSSAELSARLLAEDVPHALVNTAETLPADPQVVANALLVESEHPTAGRMRAPRPPVRFEATPASLRLPAPLLGEHSDALLDELGVGAAECSALRAGGVVGGGPREPAA
jgi:CoA:oxalate CoA-transferase